MLSVFLAADTFELNQALATFINNYVMIEKLDISIKLQTFSSQSILENLETNNHLTGIYFISINQTNSYESFQQIRKIRKHDPLGKIILLSKSNFSVLKNLSFKYRLEVLDIIDLNYEENLITNIKECLTIAHVQHMYNKQPFPSKIIIKNHNNLRAIQSSDLIYAETSSTPHKIILHLEKERLTYYDTLKTLSTISSTFIRPHHSYVINMSHFLQVDYKAKKIYLTGDQTCPLSRSGAVRIKNYLTEKPKNLRNKVRDL